MSRARVLAVLAALLGGCGDGEPDRGAATPTPTATASATPAPTAEGIDPLEGAGTEPVTQAPGERATALLTRVRAARHEGYDRVVFEFRGALPGYDVRYVPEPLHEDGSGRELTLAGDFAVQVRMENALDADLEQEGAPRTYEGPDRFSPATPVVAELARVGGFEGVLTWAVGLRDRVDFRVRTLRDPPRLVVDFRNH